MSPQKNSIRTVKITKLKPKPKTVPKKKTTDFKTTQLSAGNSTYITEQKLWHTYTQGKYWLGHTHHRTPQELLDECLSTISNLLKNHNELNLTK